MKKGWLTAFAKSIFISLLALSVIVAVGTSAQAQEPQPTKTNTKPTLRPAEPPTIIAVEFYADWCANCKELMPKFAEVKNAFHGKTVLFTRFDLTDDFTKEQAAYYAAFVGLEDVYKRSNGRTGVIALVDAKTKKIHGLINKDKTVEQIKAMLNEAISKAGT